MLIIKLNIKGKLVYKAGTQSYRALICSTDLWQFNMYLELEVKE